MREPPGPIITLTSDFGPSSPYVGVMKGVILSINPRACLVDLSHAVAPQDIRRGALVLADSAAFFPPGTLHVAVVDPGVGTSRSIVYARIASQQFIAPDNGLLSLVARGATPEQIVRITAHEFFLPRISATFHGRDIMAPVAAHLSLGVAPERLGQEAGELLLLDWPEPAAGRRRVDGEVLCADSFGNLITNITEDLLQPAPRDVSVRIVCEEHETVGIFETYAQQPCGTLLALVGSSGRLELAIVGESAREILCVGPGAAVSVEW